MSAPEIWQLVHDCYGEQLGLASDDEDYVSPSMLITNEEQLSVDQGTDLLADVSNLKYAVK